MITQTSISYYGLNYVEHAEADFKEMKAHGVTQVILAVTEFDFDFWRPNIPAIVDKAHELGLRVLIDPWGNGKYFGGEQVSKFLQDNVENRQVSALTGEKLPYACFNTNSYRDYFKNFCTTLAREAKPDGFFWDEPHYAFPKGIASITGGVADDWTCYCPVCRKRFEDYYGYPMPKYMTNDVKQFRWREALVVLADTSKALKEIDPKLEITCCVHATQNGYYVSEYRGYDNWDMVGACPYFDVFSTTIINWAASRGLLSRHHAPHRRHREEVRQEVRALAHGLLQTAEGLEAGRPLGGPRRCRGRRSPCRVDLPRRIRHGRRRAGRAQALGHHRRKL